MGKYDAKRAYSDESVVNHYDRTRFTSAGGQIFDFIEKKIAVSNIPATEPLPSILDVGSGTGRFTIEFAKQGLDVTACDISMPMLKKTREKFIHLNIEKTPTLVNGDIYNLPFKESCFDYIVCLRVLNQLGGKENVNEALEEICKVCSRNGLILFDIINLYSLSILARSDRSGLISVSQVKKLFKKIPNTRIRTIEGRLFLSQTLVEKLTKVFPKFLIIKIDSLFSKALPAYSTRVYFTVEKVSQI